ncbi:MAG: methyltransferase domain-containing protein [Candidatus Woesebacteria bacterium]|nr:methyltransferase domain-containing protein [Candidatus Woesebacteria bacterium]
MPILRMDYITLNKKVYDCLAGDYEQKVNNYFASTQKAVGFFAPYIKTGRKVLDVGCGVGLGTELLINKGFALTSMDVSTEMLRYCKKRNPKSDIIAADFLAYPFNEKFDAVFALAFIHLFPKKVAEEVLAKILNILKPGGVLYVGTTVSRVSSEGWEIKKDAFFPNSEQKRFRKHWTKKELKNSLLKTGFSIKDSYLINDPRKKVWMDFVVSKPNKN